MQPFTGASSRALLTTAAVAVTGLLTAAPAWAHVHVDADNPTPGTTSVLTFQVPGESDTGALTTQLTVDLHDVASARTEVMPGWTTRLDRDTSAGTVRSVTWTAAPGVGISPEQFALFRVSVKLPDSAMASFPVTQTYSDGSVVRWDQAPLPDGSEPEHPVPQLTLTGTPPEAGHAEHGTEAPPAPTSAPAAAVAQPAGTVDNSARWLAGGALIVAAAAVVAALLSRRRS
ncbi:MULTISPECIES: YcnI family protein [unclassified Mycolicibacterium]|uniref:YcnI family copper-binding membrane protein n=1 Tax=unclassified Mycolicibacterium TaxID=2636767 RepID=UPI0012DF053D|nr:MULTISPECIES: YcnI family protein [unclassified Mycolicibacterium]MUL83193.1 YcnI family protein [Mycolicibacterium sp. CBMA 329]MUL89528.1 YcnI family protein [Mycolicibacterium sp. CBMA 331]MUM02716.1 YcnI family protein [Mycolicibacterium sp. CBMA 334]MUM27362.1 YcnI family protein [Mycolicibacterium sp. CBMA 295]MUM39044.1 YcnI family protein [Mycolicibacterium sp. CBMA 247]